MKYASIAEIPESALVKALMADQHWRSSLFGIKGSPDRPVFRCEVLLPARDGRLQGDVDILVIPPNQPDQAIAIEVKRIKVGLGAVRSGTPNKIHELEKGRRQANQLAKLGFSQVYLWVFVVVDSREQNGGRYTYDGPRGPLRASIEDAISQCRVDAGVGFIHHEFVQPMDFEPLGVVSYGGNLRHLAVVRHQPNMLTSWVAQQFVDAA